MHTHAHEQVLSEGSEFMFPEPPKPPRKVGFSASILDLSHVLFNSNLQVEKSNLRAAR